MGGASAVWAFAGMRSWGSNGKGGWRLWRQLVPIPLLGALLLAQTAGAAPLGRSEIEAALPAIEAYIDKSMRDWQTPGLAIGIVAGDELVYAKGFGIRELGGEAPVTPETVFQIGSTSKAFLGASEAMLVEDGKLRWDDRVIDHYPAFRLKDPWVTREFRILDLLAQRSGLPAYFGTNMMVYGYDADSIIAALAHAEPRTSFRSTFAYQNAFHLVAGRIVARLGEAPDWAAFLKRRLLEPLGMNATSASAEGLLQAENRASGHRFDTRTNIVDTPGPMPYNAEGAGALNSSIRDLARWLRFHINAGEIDGRQVMDGANLAKTYEPLVAITGPMLDQLRFGDQDTVTYATGWIVHSTPQGRVVEHGGGTAGFVSHIAFDPDRRFGVIVLVNQSWNIGGGIALPVGRYVLDRLQGRPQIDYAARSLAGIREAVEAQRRAEDERPFRGTERPLADYAGRYASPVLGEIDVEVVADEGLSFTLGPQEVPVQLSRWAGDIFIATVTAAGAGGDRHTDRLRIQFLGDAQGKIDRIIWDDAGDQAGQPPFHRINATSR